MDVFTINSLIVCYIDVVRYAYRYFNINSTDRSYELVVNVMYAWKR